MQMTRRFLLGASGAVALPGLLRAQGNNPIRIGEINSYTANPAFTIPYRNAMQMAVDGVNAKGGVLGRPLELITRDDAGRPQDQAEGAQAELARGSVEGLAGRIRTLARGIDHHAEGGPLLRFTRSVPSRPGDIRRRRLPAHNGKCLKRL